VDTTVDVGEVNATVTVPVTVEGDTAIVQMIACPLMIGFTLEVSVVVVLSFAGGVITPKQSGSPGLTMKGK